MSKAVRMAVVIALLALLADGAAACWNVDRLLGSERAITASYTRRLALESVLSKMKDAETGQRGYLITRDEAYLVPYRQATEALTAELGRLHGSWPEASRRDIDALRDMFELKRTELQRTIGLAESGRTAAATAVVREGSGKQQMDAARTIAARLGEQERQRLLDAEAQSAAARRTALATLGVAAIVAFAAVGACILLLRRELINGRQVARERTALLEEAQEARRQAEGASALKDEFLAKLSHELRNPLHAMLGWLEILRQRPDHPPLRTRAVETMARNARVLQRMIEDLLDVPRAARGMLELQRAPVAFDQVVHSVVESLRPGAESKGVTIEERNATMPCPVEGDADRLTQVAVNLIANAIKFTPPGGRVTVTLEYRNGRVSLSIADTGLGIPPDSLRHIFEPFRQAGPPIAGPEGGLGLGLAIARQIIELHGGTITAASAGLGGGAQFDVDLPMVLAPAATQ